MGSLWVIQQALLDKKCIIFSFLISRFNNAQHSRATTPKNTSTLVNTLDLVSMGSGSRKTRNKTPTSMAKTPTSNIVGSGTLSNQQKHNSFKDSEQRSQLAMEFLRIT